MIHFIVASQPEARPIIDIFRLKKVTNKYICLYKAEDISLTISGIGKVNSAISVIKTFYEFSKEKNNIWINFGLAGHENIKIGSIFLVNKVEDIGSKKKIYPFINDFKILSIGCETFETVNHNYNQNLSDMECSGFFQAANQYSCKELIYSLKVISDNHYKSINFRDKREIYDIIIQNKKVILDYCHHIKELRRHYEFNFDDKVDKMYLKLFKSTKFTFTETQQMKSLLRTYLSSYKNISTKIFDLKKNGSHNIKLLKDFLKI